MKNVRVVKWARVAELRVESLELRDPEVGFLTTDQHRWTLMAEKMSVRTEGMQRWGKKRGMQAGMPALLVPLYNVGKLRAGRMPALLVPLLPERATMSASCSCEVARQARNLLRRHRGRPSAGYVGLLIRFFTVRGLRDKSGQIVPGACHLALIFGSTPPMQLTTMFQVRNSS